MPSEDVPLETVCYETLTSREDGGPSSLLLDYIAEKVFDIAHENCEDDGCGGGLPYWRDVTEVVLMAVADHMRENPPATYEAGRKAERETCAQLVLDQAAAWHGAGTPDGMMLAAELRRVVADLIRGQDGDTNG